MTALLHGAFFLSGAAGLALEMLWMRSAALAVGGTATTAAVVLSCYFAGLALGAALARHPVPRPVRRYGRLELGVALGGVWSWLVFAAAAYPIVPTTPPWAALLVAVAILPASACLGGTLPALGQALARGAAGVGGGRLAAVNTLGAVVGAGLAGFGLPAWIGVRASYALAVAGSALAGAVALSIGDRDAVALDAAPRPLVPRHRAGAAAAGALALGLEVLWIRVFAQVLHNSVYSFTAVALVFLLAIALGAALGAAALRRIAPATVAATAALIAGFATVLGYRVFVALTDGFDYVGMRSGLGEYLLRIVGLGLVTVGPAALAGAAILPALWATSADRDVARPLGSLSAANSLGAAAGAALAGFVVMPALGLRVGLLLAAIGYLVLADAVRPAGGRHLAWAALIAIALLDPLREPLTRLRDGEVVRATRETAAGIVSVVDTGDDLQLRVDTWYTLGGSAAVANERRQGLLPLLLHPDPQRAAFIGLATGISASAAPALGVHDTTVFEVVPAVAEAARTHFARWNDGLLDRSDVHLVLDDGRHALARSPERWDVIVSDLFVPWHAGTGNLYAREMYATAAARLTPGGLFCQWLPLYQLTRDEFDVIAHTFTSVFPHASLWRDDFYADRPVVALIGTLATQPLDVDALRTRLAAHAERLHDPLLATPQALAMLDAGDLGAVADAFGDAPIDRDDRPVIEFGAPRLTRLSTAGDKDWFVGAPLAAFYDRLADAAVGTRLLPPARAIDDGRRAGLAMVRYTLAQSRHDERAAAAQQAIVRALVPDVVARADDAGSSPGAAAAIGAAERLHAEQAALRRELAEMERRLDDLDGARR